MGGGRRREGVPEGGEGASNGLLMGRGGGGSRKKTMVW